jgi:predicted flap endonuclease-1-like 5' DNA nuclease
MYILRILEEGGNEAGMGAYVWVALAIFFLMVFLGWLVSSRDWLQKEEEPVVVGEGHHDSHEAIETDKKAMQINIQQKIDDLTLLEGIGPKVAKILAGLGVTTFDGLSKADYGEIKKALDAAGYKYMDPAGWIDQAKLAANGDQAGLEKLQKSLKGGRKVK